MKKDFYKSVEKMRILIYITILILVLFFLWVIQNGKQGESEKFIGLNYYDPRKEEFYELVDPWGHKILDEHGNPIENRNLLENGKNDIKELDFTPSLPEFVNHEKFNEIILQGLIEPTTKKYCSNGENICRNTIEKLYECEFKNVRLDCLKNPKTGNNLEIDCYNEDLHLGIEYNGEHHYKYPNRFHTCLEEFKKQVERDELKKKLCEENGIHLIVVPYNISHKIIPSYILQKLPQNNDENGEEFF